MNKKKQTDARERENRTQQKREPNETNIHVHLESKPNTKQNPLCNYNKLNGTKRKKKREKKTKAKKVNFIIIDHLCRFLPLEKKMQCSQTGKTETERNEMK